MAKEKTKKNLFARIPNWKKNWMKVWAGASLASAAIGYLTLGAVSGEWNPLKYDESRKARIEQFELKKRRLGPLSGPIKIIVPYIFRDQYAYGHLVGKEADREATKRERVRVEKLGEKIFGEKGYADVNKNKIIELTELTGVYIRMGLDSKVMQTGRFPDVSAEHLEQAVKSYELDD